MELVVLLTHFDPGNVDDNQGPVNWCSVKIEEKGLSAISFYI